jgi:transcriptional regulator with XRE-family HTH domain
MRMTQEQLGAKLGLTFQQVQKYEKGTNRIAASRLDHISKILKVPVSAFFGDASDSGVDIGIVTNRNRGDILTMLDKLNSTKVELGLIELLRVILDNRVERSR